MDLLDILLPGVFKGPRAVDPNLASVLRMAHIYRGRVCATLT